MTKTVPSPFHHGEQEIQSRLGVREQIENVGQRFIRDYMPDEHRQFLAQLPFLLVGSIDKSGRPWASVLVGRPGFLNSSDPRTLEIHSRPLFGDPLNDNLAQDAQLGMLGIEFSSRRRNRLNGDVSSMDEGYLKISVGQSFGNCPQYIQARDFELLPAIDHIGEPRPVQTINKFDQRVREIISQADQFYIATHLSENRDDVTNGTDVSHRGGKPGFVRIDDNKTLTFPDFSGNYHFNTLGNILLNPRAGLLFIDFEKGDLLYLTCSAKIIWDSEECRAFTGAERLVRFSLDEGILVEGAMPIRWNFLEYSPSLDQTGSWDEVTTKIEELERGNVYCDYTVAKVEVESEVITSFYLEPETGSGIACHSAGQFLPIEIQLPGATEPIRRTYTISNAPNGAYYRLSIKKEPAAQADFPPGAASNYFHDHVIAGSTIRAMTPRGKFTLDESSTRPVVLLSGGVGVTPMISMLEHLAETSDGCGCTRQVWFIHGAINSKYHGFDRYVRALATDYSCLNVHVRYSQTGVVLDESSTRPVVLLSGGVGVTPMISMLEHLAETSDGCGCTRQVWFIHGAINSKYHGFDRYVRALATDYSCLNVHVRYSRPSEDDVEGKNFDSTGRVDIDLIKSLLPFDDYEFYMCGPPAFLESLYEGLKDLNVADGRIHYEFFGPGATLLREQPGQTLGLAEDLQDREPVLVRFARSETQATWDPSKGTLLDLAEAEGLRPAYSCRSGICQTCSTKITAGQVDYLEAPMATPDAGEALLCCSYPKLADGENEVVLDI